MAIKSEISWSRRDADGAKLEVYARRFGGDWKFYSRARRNEQWEPIPNVTLEDWLLLLDGIRRRIPRKLFPPAEFDKVRRTIRERFPETPMPEGWEMSR